MEFRRVLFRPELQSHSHLVSRRRHTRRECDWSRSEEHTSELQSHSHLVCRLLLLKQKLLDRKSTRLNSSHTLISYAAFCLKKTPRRLRRRTGDRRTAASARRSAAGGRRARRSARLILIICPHPRSTLFPHTPLCY